MSGPAGCTALCCLTARGHNGTLPKINFVRRRSVRPSTVLNLGLVRGSQINIQTSVVGLLFLELQVLSETGVEWEPAAGFSLDEADLIRENFLAKAASWRRGTADLSSLAGKKVQVHAAMVDAKVFSFVFGCASNTTKI